MLPRISVVTPSYRQAAYIESTLQSVLSQRYPNLEYIVIDGAGDDTARILERYDSQLAYWCSEPDGGQYDAINKGFAKATGDILCWINSDDMLLPRSLFVAGEAFARFPEVQWLSSLCPGVWDADGNLGGFLNLPGFSKQGFLDGVYLPGTLAAGYWIQQESTFFTRSLWEKCGARIPDCKVAGDFALWCSFYRHSDLVGLEYPLAAFRTIAGQRSEDGASYTAEARTALQELRAEAGWKSTPAVRMLGSRVARIGVARRMIGKALSYEATRIRNRRWNQPGGDWRLESYRFIP